MVHTVQEVGVAERDVTRTGVDELPDVVEHSCLVDDPDASVVHDRHRAMATAMRAAVTRLDVADHPVLAVHGQVRVPVERREEVASGPQPGGGRAPSELDG